MMDQFYGSPASGDSNRAAMQHVVEERRWGYVLNAPGKTYAGLTTMQRLSVLLAAYILSFSLSSGVPILLGFTVGVDPMRLAMTIFCFALALPFLWYASRGNKAYVYVNVYRNEVREVVPHLLGKPTVLRRMPFSDIGGVRLDHRGSGERAVLSLRKNGAWCQIAVLDGCQKQLTSLRDRMARDVFSPQLPEAAPAAANVAYLPASYRTEPVHLRGVA